jgi:hypothetical protein
MLIEVEGQSQTHQAVAPTSGQEPTLAGLGSLKRCIDRCWDQGLIPLCIYFVIALLDMRMLLFSSGLFTGTDFLTFSYNVHEIRVSDLGYWQPNQDLGHNGISTEVLLFTLSSWLPGSSLEVTREVTFILLLLSGLTVFYLARQFVGLWPSAYAGTVFLLSPALMGQFVEGHLDMIYSMAVFPASLTLFYLSYRRTVRGEVLQPLFYTTLAFVLIIAGSPVFLYMGIVTLGFSSLVILIVSYLFDNSPRAHLRFLLVVGLGLAASTATLIPFLISTPTLLPTLSAFSPSAIASNSDPFLNALFGQPMDRSYLFQGILGYTNGLNPYVYSQSLSWIGLVPASVGLVGYPLVRGLGNLRKPSDAFVFAVYVVSLLSIILSMGLSGPFSWVNSAALQVVPDFNSIDSVPARWGFFTVTAESFIGALVLSDLYERHVKSTGQVRVDSTGFPQSRLRRASKRYARVVAPTLAIVCVIGTVLASYNALAYPPRSYDLPGIDAAYSFLGNQSGSFNVMVWPLGSAYVQSGPIVGLGRSPLEAASLWLTNSGLLADGSANVPIEEFAPVLANSLASGDEGAAPLLGALGIKYILADSALTPYYGGGAGIPVSRAPFGMAEFTPVSSTDNVTIYQNAQWIPQGAYWSGSYNLIDGSFADLMNVSSMSLVPGGFSGPTYQASYLTKLGLLAQTIQEAGISRVLVTDHANTSLVLDLTSDLVVDMNAGTLVTSGEWAIARGSASTISTSPPSSLFYDTPVTSSIITLNSSTVSASPNLGKNASYQVLAYVEEGPESGSISLLQGGTVLGTVLTSASTPTWCWVTLADDAQPRAGVPIELSSAGNTSLGPVEIVPTPTFSAIEDRVVNYVQSPLTAFRLVIPSGDMPTADSMNYGVPKPNDLGNLNVTLDLHPTLLDPIIGVPRSGLYDVSIYTNRIDDLSTSLVPLDSNQVTPILSVDSIPTLSPFASVYNGTIYNRVNVSSSASEQGGELTIQLGLPSTIPVGAPIEIYVPLDTSLSSLVDPSNYLNVSLNGGIEPQSLQVRIEGLSNSSQHAPVNVSTFVDYGQAEGLTFPFSEENATTASRAVEQGYPMAGLALIGQVGSKHNATIRAQVFHLDSNNPIAVLNETYCSSSSISYAEGFRKCTMNGVALTSGPYSLAISSYTNATLLAAELDSSNMNVTSGVQPLNFPLSQSVVTLPVPPRQGVITIENSFTPGWVVAPQAAEEFQLPAFDVLNSFFVNGSVSTNLTITYIYESFLKISLILVGVVLMVPPALIAVISLLRNRQVRLRRR